MKNGFTPPTHGVGSRTGWPPERSGDQCPGAVFGTHCDSPNRPSPSLASSMALAAACPTAMPCSLKESSSIASSEATYSEASVFRSAARLVNGALSGAVETSSESTTYAAVATAASIDAFAPARLPHEVQYEFKAFKSGERAGNLKGLYAAVAQDASESATGLRVAVMEYVSLAAESAAFHIGEVATHLLDPRLRRMGVTPASVTRLVSSWMTNRT
jgi:hypothetical protein